MAHVEEGGVVAGKGAATMIVGEPEDDVVAGAWRMAEEEERSARSIAAATGFGVTLDRGGSGGPMRHDEACRDDG